MKKLQTETNTPAMEKRVRAAARELLCLQGRIQTDFEHGQWWVTQLLTGAQWSVCDASGPGSSRGFCFEQVTQGDEEGAR